MDIQTFQAVQLMIQGFGTAIAIGCFLVGVYLLRNK